jgi:hypothetical protein
MLHNKLFLNAQHAPNTKNTKKKAMPALSYMHDLPHTLNCGTLA